MEAVIIWIIFLVLGVSLYRNQKAAMKKYEAAKEQAEFKSTQSASVRHRKWLHRVQLITSVLLMAYLAASIIRPLNQLPILILAGIFAALYYYSQYQLNEEWFFDRNGLWSSCQLRQVGYENIVDYECLTYGERCVVRVKYKGRGIMLIKSDYLVSQKQKEPFLRLLKERMAGI